MSGQGWFVGLGILYLVLLFTLGVLTFRKGYWVLSLLGIVFPLLWPDRNVLRRRSDRVEAAMMAALVAGFLIGAPAVVVAVAGESEASTASHKLHQARRLAARHPAGTTASRLAGAEGPTRRPRP